MASSKSHASPPRAPKPPPRKSKPSPHKAHPYKPPVFLHPTNGVFSAAGYGKIGVYIGAITFGTSIISRTSPSRLGRALYTNAQSSFSFGVAVLCPTDARYVRLADWIEGYGAKVQSGTVGLMRVQLPSRHFDRMGVPNGTSRGADYRDVIKTITMGFIGASDLVPLSSTDVTRLSGVSGPVVKDRAVAYFYPTGTQLSGAAKGADLLYDSTSATFTDGDTAATITSPPPLAPSPGNVIANGGTVYGSGIA